ncbi:hypothetical protein QCA50_013063 [Cerrena zonata]|uniref:Heme haloperoxidase family profile domain-containing protein n=1 Tax=Cerrena zonata TaxID=2478898 RepID=A0AAW0FWI2_9APHY
MGDSFAMLATIRILLGLFSILKDVLTNTVVIIIDTGLAIYNALAPKRPANAVTPHGAPGAGGLWPTFEPAREGDSRCSCPALNAMANHGILPHSGKGIAFKDLSEHIRNTYNFSPTFCFFVPNYIAGVLRRDYWSDSFDLADIDVHNGIEHDASLTREDSVFVRDQGKPAKKLIEELLMSGTGPGGNLTAADLSRIAGKRRAESKVNNLQYSLSFIHKFFSSANSSTLITIFGGQVKDLRPFLLEERIPDGWQSHVRTPFGLTMAAFNPVVMSVELGIKEELPAAFAEVNKVD